MNKKLITTLSLLVALAFALSACTGAVGGTPTASTPPAQAEAPEQSGAPETPPEAAPSNLPPIKLGSIQDLTGTASESGQANAWGVEYAVNEINAAGGINGRQIELFTLDCKNDAEEALNAYRKLVDEHEIDALIGPPLSNSALTWVDLVTEDEIPCVGHFMDESCTTNPDTGEAYPYMFLAEPGCRQQAFSLAEFGLTKLGLKSFAMIYNSQNAFAVTQAQPFMEYVQAKGAAVVAEETFTWTDTDYSAQCIKVVNANPEAVVITDYAAQAKLLTQQLRDAGFTGVILGANTFGPPFQTMYEGDLKGIYFLQNYDSYSKTAECYNLLQAYMAEFGKDYPVANAAFGYDAVLVMADAMRRASDPTNGPEVRDLLETVSGVATTSGPVKLDAATHRPTGIGMFIGEYSEDRSQVNIAAYIAVPEDAV